MTLVYFDSSAFVKLLVEEDGSDLAAGLWDRCDAAVSSRLAQVEVPAALAAAGRAGRLDRDQLATTVDVWQGCWSATRPVELTADVAARAAGLSAEHAVRGADAVHLASALAVGGGLLLACWDARLAVGALAVGVDVVPAPR